MTASTPTAGTTTATVQMDPPAGSWAAPGESDRFAWIGLVVLLGVLFLVVYLYALFDRYAEHRGSSTPLRTTIPTMLTVGLAYDLLPPLEGVNVLLPLALILGALARDIVLWIKPEEGTEAGHNEIIMAENVIIEENKGSADA
ncbi:hypothetical protein [Chachezhania sediminis]|uniref:hypothetical protein n=1 Tax=Chachezhania sediminis TaxID=2599291 RepID=UPI00131E04CE|nr:hypothetical protein [Chachezhania sediminis]